MASTSNNANRATTQNTGMEGAANQPLNLLPNGRPIAFIDGCTFVLDSQPRPYVICFPEKTDAQGLDVLAQAIGPIKKFLEQFQLKDVRVEMNLGKWRKKKDCVHIVLPYDVFPLKWKEDLEELVPQRARQISEDRVSEFEWFNMAKRHFLWTQAAQLDWFDGDLANFHRQSGLNPPVPTPSTSIASGNPSSSGDVHPAATSTSQERNAGPSNPHPPQNAGASSRKKSKSSKKKKQPGNKPSLKPKKNKSGPAKPQQPKKK